MSSRWSGWLLERAITNWTQFRGSVNYGISIRQDGHARAGTSWQTSDNRPRSTCRYRVRFLQKWIYCSVSARSTDVLYSTRRYSAFVEQYTQPMLILGHYIDIQSTYESDWALNEIYAPCLDTGRQLTQTATTAVWIKQHLACTINQLPPL